MIDLFGAAGHCNGSPGLDVDLTVYDSLIESAARSSAEDQ